VPSTPRRKASRSTSKPRSVEEAVNKKKTERNAGGLRRSYVDFLAWMITIFWGGSFLADMTLKEYDPPAAIHALMTIVAGAAFGGTLLKAKNGED
jgi:hypothetical protein